MKYHKGKVNESRRAGSMVVLGVQSVATRPGGDKLMDWYFKMCLFTVMFLKHQDESRQSHHQVVLIICLTTHTKYTYTQSKVLNYQDPDSLS